VSGRIVPLDQGRIEDAVLRTIFDFSQGFTFIRREGRNEHQADDVRGVGGGVADDRTAVRVTGARRMGPSICLSTLAM
jgi:hypothetical protein